MQSRNRALEANQSTQDPYSYIGQIHFWMIMTAENAENVPSCREMTQQVAHGVAVLTDYFKNSNEPM